MVEEVWGSIVAIILFAVGALLIITLMGKSLIGIQGSFETSICKFNAWMRANTVGSPALQILIGTSGFITGGFGRQIATSVTMPLVCKKAQELPPKANNASYTIREALDKILMESVSCWDQFGLGKWDSLVLSDQGQTFTCYEQKLDINCTRQDVINLWKEQTEEVNNIVNANLGNFTQSVLNYYTETNYYDYAGINKTYNNILPRNSPKIGKDYGGQIICDGVSRNYYVSIIYIDVFSTLKGLTAIPLVCDTVNLADERSDQLYMCVFTYND